MITLTILGTAFASIFEFNIMGVSVGFLSILFLILFVDFLTGIAASVREGKEIKSRKGERTIIKLALYTLYIAMMAQAPVLLQEISDTWLFMLDVIRYTSFLLILVWEWQSIGENLLRLYGRKPKIFTLMDFVSVRIERFFKGTIDKVFTVDKDNKEPE